MIQPQEATKAMLAALPSRRMRDIIEKRFGLKGGKKKTLDAIGQEYRITRERVRQIEADALKRLRKSDGEEHGAGALLRAAENHINRHGNVMAEQHLLATLVDEPRYHPHMAFLLEIGPQFTRVPETETRHQCVAVHRDAAPLAARIMSGVSRDLGQKKDLVSAEVLYDMIGKRAAEESGEERERHVLEAYFATTKGIGRNPYGEYGLISWPTTNPRGVRDKAYVVLSKIGKPLHFTDVTDEINKVSWSTSHSFWTAQSTGVLPSRKGVGSKRRAHPQTVHNELIKDARFVLVGRGLYALAEWGFEPGVVRDVLVSVLRKTGRPMTKEEITKDVQAKRFVKAPTILLNLQNKSFFQKVNGDKYILV